MLTFFYCCNHPLLTLCTLVYKDPHMCTLKTALADLE